MSKVGVVAKITAQPGKRDELASALQSMLQAVESEEGTLSYVLHADNAKDDVLWMYELYTDQASLESHMNGEAFKALGPVIGGLLAGRPELNFTTPLGGKGL